MNVGVCLECREILAVGDFNPKIPPTHRVKGKTHTGTVLTIENDPMGDEETPTDYLKRLKRAHKAALFG